MSKPIKTGRRMAAPGAKRGVRWFATPREARGHFCDHVLTWTEAYAWSILIAGYMRTVGLAYGDRRNMAQSLWQGEGASGPRLEGQAGQLLAAYRKYTEAAMEDARDHGWWWVERYSAAGKPVRWGGFGSIGGIMIVWNHLTLVSAHVRGFGFKEVASADRYHDPLPREAWQVRVEPDAAPDHFWVFRTSLAAVRRKKVLAYSSMGSPDRLPKDVLPKNDLAWEAFEQAARPRA